MGGNKNNPSPRQFNQSNRKLLLHSSVELSINCNLTPQDHTDLLSIHSNLIPACDIWMKMLVNDPQLISNNDLTFFTLNISSYIAGFIIKKLVLKLTCSTCINALANKANSKCKENSLIEIKNNGGLYTPSDSVKRICQLVEKYLKHLVLTTLFKNINYFKSKIEIEVMKNLAKNLFEQNYQHFKETLYEVDSHFTDHIKNICREYINIRIFSMVRTENYKFSCSSIRQKNNSIVNLGMNKKQNLLYIFNQILVHDN